MSLFQSLSEALQSSLVGRVVVYVCSPDRRLVIESCRQGSCVCVHVLPLTGDLLSSLVGRVVVYVCSPDRRLVIESCRQGGCVCVLP